jgi:hypothetical protein
LCAEKEAEPIDEDELNSIGDDEQLSLWSVGGAAVVDLETSATARMEGGGNYNGDRVSRISLVGRILSESRYFFLHTDHVSGSDGIYSFH